MSLKCEPAQEKSALEKKLCELSGVPLADTTAFLVALHLPSMQRIAESLPKLIEDERAGTENIWVVKGYFKNKLQYLNEKARTILLRHAARVGMGWYLTSERGLERLISEIDELRETEYKKYERDLANFLLHGKIPDELKGRDDVKLYEEYTELVKRYLEQNGVELTPPRIADGVTLDVLPLALDSKTIERVASERVKVEASKMLEKLSRDFIKDIERRFEELSKKLKRARSIMHVKQTREAIKKEIEALQSLCADMGMKVPPELLRSIERFEKEYEKFVDDVVEERVKSARAQAVLKTIAKDDCPF